ncbi:hypothetical protein JYU34_011629 [Plutella xylostella]|uniref:Glycosyltransferase family 92 protein n=2 Tax=Plutella xylostella TaxID=51655 RepID=A0ABQ7QEH0_PLUXY|nr:hypothetical protein JYU34_011629 [Plutella xylostella]
MRGVRVACAWCGGAGGRRARVLGALLAWGALLALGMPRLAPAPAPAPAARALLHAATPPATPPPSSPAPPPPAPDALSDAELRADAARRLPSLPLDYLQRAAGLKNKFYKTRNCAPLPSLYDLQFHDTYWQTMRADNDTAFHLFGAYLDDRNTSRIGPAVRLLAVHDRLRPALKTHCQIWFEEQAAPVIVRVLEYKYIWNSKWGNYRDGLWQPYLLACVLPAGVRHLRPAAVSLVREACDAASNLLRVQGGAAPGPPEDLAVCVKGLDFLHEDLSLRLVEWLELVLLLGARAVHMYQLQAHANVQRVLAHYQARGLLTLTPLTLPGGMPNLPALQHIYLKKKTNNKRQMELIPYNDCLYRHQGRYRWLALLDVDEVIVPAEDADWPALLRRALPLAAPAPGKPPRSAYYASNLYYLDSLQQEQGGGPEPGVPAHLHMLSHVWRTRNFTRPGQYVKAFHDTQRVLTLHNHFPLACLGGACSNYPLPTALARLQHYRADCVRSLSASCAALRDQPVRDTTLWRWRDALAGRVDAALRALRLGPHAPPPAPADPLR